MQTNNLGSLSDATIPGDENVFAGPAFMAAHGGDLPGYGSGVLVRLRGGASAGAAFDATLNKTPPEGWFNQAGPASEVDLKTVRRVIDLERRALLVFALIAVVASVVFVGLTAVRQLRRESADAYRLAALGMTRRDLRVINVARALTIAAPACLVAIAGIVALSPFGPLGLARKLEYHLGVRVDGRVLAATVLALLIMFAVSGLIAPVRVNAVERTPVHRPASRLEPALRGMGPVALVGATVARGRSTRAAIAVTAIAVAAGVAAGGIVASYDWLVGKPARYGASWDVVVGQYSQQGPLDTGIAKLRANPAVVAAAGYYEQGDVGKVDGKDALFLTLRQLRRATLARDGERTRAPERRRGGPRPRHGANAAQGHRRHGDGRGEQRHDQTPARRGHRGGERSDRDPVGRRERRVRATTRVPPCSPAPGAWRNRS